MSNPTVKSKAGLSWLIKMAWRDGKASGKRLLLFIASIVLGIAAVVSIESFSENLKTNIASQSKALIGADYAIGTNRAPTEKLTEIVDSLQYDGMEVSFVSMAAFSKNEASRLVQVRGIAAEFPLYGEIETVPKSAAEDYKVKNGALVDATLMLQFKLKVGDEVKIGELTFPIVGSVVSAPGGNAISATFAPPVIIPHKFIENTGLLQTGSRYRYTYYYQTNVNFDVETLGKTLDPVLDIENADFDSHLSVSRRLGRRYENFAKFLNLVAFIALLLGAIGIASSVHIYIKEKLKGIAVLKCLGATRRQTFLIYVIQITGIGLLGGIVGTTAGLALQQFLPLLLQDILPFSITIDFTLQPIVLGLLLGVFMSVLFALFPLLATWYVSPLEVLRVQNSGSTASKRIGIFILVGILFFIYLFSYWLLQNSRLAIVFVLAVLVTLSILAGVAILVMKAIKRYFPTSWGFTARTSLLNLYRPNNQTMVLLLAIGIGSFLISTLYFTKDILLAKATVEANAKSPNIILLDVQSNQKEYVANTIRPKGLDVIDNIPIVTMRMHSIKGALVNDLRTDTTVTIRKWILNHEFRVTYRDSLVASEVLASGTIKNDVPENGPIPISLSDNVARDAKVIVGDTLVFNIQGVLMETTVASIRKVDWGRMQLNFSIVFPEGVLEEAPQFHVITTNSPDKKTSAKLQQELVRLFPNVSVIDLRQVLALIQGILDKISLVINFMAFFSILTGIIVLIGSVRNSKYQRMKESALLKTLGATSAQLLKITVLEYFYLGILGSGIGILLSLLSSQLLAWLVFDSPFVPSWVPFLILLPGITVLVLLIGLVNSRSVLQNPPLQIIRKQQY